MSPSPLPRRATVHRAAAALATVVLVSLSLALAPPPAGAADVTTLTPRSAGGIDAGSRQSVLDAYNNWYRRDEGAKPNWTGSTDRCDPGTVSPALSAATESRVNFFRALAGMPPVRLDPALAPAAQQAALMMAANGTLNHYPPSTWRCWTQAGATAAGRSNLGSIEPGPTAVTRYMGDDHRYLILGRWLGTIDHGATYGTDVLSAGASAASGVDGPITWPPVGYSPAEAIDLGLWSIDIPGARFTDATVQVTNGAGTPTTTSRVATVGGNDRELMWHVPDAARWFTTDATYNVTVSNVYVGASTTPQTYRYQITLVATRPPAPVTPPPAPPVAPPPPAPARGTAAPMGALDAVAVEGRRIRLSGWVSDPDRPQGDLGAVITVGGRPTLVAPNAWRPDLVPLNMASLSGLVIDLDVPAGTHTVCLHALDHDGVDYTGWATTVGCQRVVVK